jgi:hypothetical protein
LRVWEEVDLQFHTQTYWPTQHAFSRRTARLRIVLAFVLLLAWFYPRASAAAQSGICTAEFQSVAIPLTELGAHTYTRMDGQITAFTGGLYPSGENTPPRAHMQAALSLAREIVPRAGDGQVDLNSGKIGLVSVGMSNTNYEFDAFQKLAGGEETINPQLVLVNGALGGQTADKWVDPNAIAWQELHNTLERYGLTDQQVQVAWVKETLTRGGDFPAKTQDLQSDLAVIVTNLKTAFPQLKIVYLSSRIYSYTYERGLSPEPLAYETGFAVKWLIEDQINADPDLNYDPARGVVKAPLLLWGPYLWANGTQPRADGLTWLPQDLTNDCTHPAETGTAKVAAMLWNFFSTDQTTKSWFLRDGETGHDLFLPVITSTVTSVPSAVVKTVETVTPTQKLLHTASETANPLPGSSADQSAPAAIWPLALAGGVGVVFGLVWVGRRRSRG